MMIAEKNNTLYKTAEINDELKKIGLWKKAEPLWVKDYEANTKIIHNDFSEWLQFVYLPNCLQNNGSSISSIVPQAIKYFGDDVKKGKLLQLLIELDALV